MQIRSATPHDLEPVTALLSEVFASDPLMRAITAPASNPQRALEHLIHTELATHYLCSATAKSQGARVDLAVIDQGTAADKNLPNRQAFVLPTGEVLVGTMLWEPPSTSAVNACQDRSPLELGFDPHLLNVQTWKRVQLDERICLQARPAPPHWYAYMIAVHNSCQGMGIGSALMRHGLKRVDRDALPAHLEATNLGAKRLYERWGFVETTVLCAPPLPTYWAMTRPPQCN